MKTARFLPLAALLAWAVLAAGCAAPFSEELLRQSDRSVTVDMVLASPDAHRNALVTWGGVLLNTRPREKYTSLEVSERPLDSRSRPRDENLSRGRFMARYNGFLDPTVFSHGKDVTVVGRVTGTETGRIGDYEYTYPVVTIEEYHLWEVREDYGPPPPPNYPCSPFWGPWWRY